MSDTRVIVNPIAGRGAGMHLLPQITGWLRGDGLDFSLAITEAPGHATALASDAVAQGCRTVLAVGGDGTSHEILNGLLQASAGPDDVALGVLPVGTGNDFAFGAGVPLDVREACRVATRGQTRTLDVGWVRADEEEPHYFGNGLGLGFDAIVNMESRKIRRLRGFAVYLVAVLKTLAVYYDAPQVTIQIDEEEWVQCSLMISIMNGQRMGGGFYTTPEARMDDSLLDLCITNKVGRPKMVAFVPRFMRGTHTTDRDVAMRQGCRVTVTSDTPWAAQVDGEIYGVGARRFEVVLLPQRLCLLC